MGPARLEQYKALANCHKNDGSGPIVGIQRTNGFRVGIYDADGKEINLTAKRAYTCVGADASRLNHRCGPVREAYSWLSRLADEYP